MIVFAAVQKPNDKLQNCLLMNASIHQKALLLPLLLLLFVFFFEPVLAQNNVITGKVTNESGTPLVGATVLVKGTSLSVISDETGGFKIENATPSGILVVSYVGYDVNEIKYTAGKTITVRLVNTSKSEDEVVVTGVFDKRKKLESSIAISTINAKQLERVIPNSAADLLRNIPGVYVNASRGEIGNSIYTRGLSLTSNGGFYYVSMQEDGLPVIVTTGAVQPDMFLRADITVNRIEAVRGGTASILGANAPGGIFNYLSRTGGSKFAGEIRTRYGLEGNGKNPYYRADFNFGGPFSEKDKSWTYNIGGFYRHADGAKYPGYPLSRGYQFKGNILKTYNKGTFKIFGKILNDNTGSFEFTPTQSFSDPKVAGNFTNSSSVLVRGVRFKVPAALTAGVDVDYNSEDLNKYKDKSIGANWEHRLGNGWTLNNSLKFSKKYNTNNSTSVVYPFAINSPVFFAVIGHLGFGAPKFGTYSFKSLNTGVEMANITFAPGPNGLTFTKNVDNLPGANVQPTSLFYNPVPFTQMDINEFTEQFSISKKLKNMNFTFGGFFSSQKLERYTMIPTAQSFGTIEDKPQGVAITWKPLGPPSTLTYKVTDVNGLLNYGGGGTYYDNAITKQAALFFGHNWQINDQWNLDWGFRAENLNIKWSHYSPVRGADSKGGFDGDSTTLYDNRVYTKGPMGNYKKELGTFSYSAGLNYKIDDATAVYFRFSNGRKSPDLAFYLDIANSNQAAQLKPEAQKTLQFELGLKSKGYKHNLFVTPFYTLLSNVPNFQIFQNPDATYYSPSRTYQKIQTMGIEFEGDYSFTPKFNVRAVAVVQTSKAIDYSVYLARTNGPADDSLVVFSGNKTDNIAPLMFTVTPSYTTGKFYAGLAWSYMGKRWANLGNAFQLPSYHQLDLNLAVDLTKNVRLSASVNNLFNTYGVMSWSAPGGFPAALDLQGFTAQALAANPNAIYSTIAIQPRAYFLTASFKF